MNDPLDFYHQVWPTHSEYAKRWLNRFPQWDSTEHDEDHLLNCIETWLEKARELSDEKALMAELRLVRQRSMIEIMRRDLQGKVDLFEVTEALSFLADAAVQIALKFSHKMQAERFGEPADGDCMMVVGMGKLGGLELNASSDIDLIFCTTRMGKHWAAPRVKPNPMQNFSRRWANVSSRLFRK